ncbi:MAG: ABC transporter ATP-binding protein [Bacteroidetes bacterium]|jgi:Cu-processing system ATP-binding protein|nr:ABC transporter ATP-binding protein [Bacteroidota bacterium]
MIVFQDLKKNFGKFEVLKTINLKINEGGIFAILGPNGSGKTTLIKSLLGMVIPQNGTITINNQQVIHKWNYRDKVDYLPQIANFPSNLKVIELINMVKDIRGRKCRDQELINLFRITPFLNKKLGTLSGGTKQRVNLVLTFMFDSPLIILDEPTSGLDPVALITLKELIINEKAKGKTIIITSHIMSFVEELSDEVVFILDGEIYFQGSVSKLKEQTKQSSFEYAIASILKEQYV